MKPPQRIPTATQSGRGGFATPLPELSGSGVFLSTRAELPGDHGDCVPYCADTSSHLPCRGPSGAGCSQSKCPQPRLPKSWAQPPKCPCFCPCLKNRGEPFQKSPWVGKEAWETSLNVGAMAHTFSLHSCR